MEAFGLRDVSECQWLSEPALLPAFRRAASVVLVGPSSGHVCVPPLQHPSSDKTKQLQERDQQNRVVLAASDPGLPDVP